MTRPRLRDDPDTWTYVDQHPMSTVRAVVWSVLAAFVLGVLVGSWWVPCGC